MARERHSDTATVELHWLQTAETTRLTFDNRSLQRFFVHVDRSIADLAAAHQEGAFPPKPSSYRCRRCEFRTICDEGRDIR
jgi:CRISPR/Cas system-associated exonuclease Cas4 (RecB family)